MNQNLGCFKRRMIVAGGINLGLTASAILALAFLTRGGGESHRDSAAIDAVAGVLQILSFPLAWLIERAAFSRNLEPGFLFMLGSRTLNGAVFGGLAAWVWGKLRPASSGV